MDANSCLSVPTLKHPPHCICFFLCPYTQLYREMVVFCLVLPTFSAKVLLKPHRMCRFEEYRYLESTFQYVWPLCSMYLLLKEPRHIKSIGESFLRQFCPKRYCWVLGDEHTNGIRNYAGLVVRVMSQVYLI